MTGSSFQPGKLFRHHDHLPREILPTGRLALDVFKNRSTPRGVEIALHATEFANIVKVSGAPARVSRGRTEIANDGGNFLGVDLSPAMIAQKHHISLRYLHLIFSEQGTTVGTWLRSRRLAKCRGELANLRNDRSVTEIAMNWGFSDVAHFSRSFRSAYGVSPLRFRRTRDASSP